MDTPFVTYDERGNCWILERRWCFLGFCVPKGFRFDLASVPRCLWWAIAPFELSLSGALLHDWMYRNGGLVNSSHMPHRSHYTRQQADSLFLILMEKEGVPYWRRTLAYLAVRCFGWRAWQG